MAATVMVHAVADLGPAGHAAVLLLHDAMGVADGVGRGLPPEVLCTSDGGACGARRPAAPSPRLAQRGRQRVSFHVARRLGHRVSATLVALGLFVAHEVVEAPGGRIWLESAPGQGARMSLELPAEFRRVHQSGYGTTGSRS